MYIVPSTYVSVSTVLTYIGYLWLTGTVKGTDASQSLL